jgi:hypothetical protein
MNETPGHTYQNDEEFFTDLTNKFEFARQEGISDYLEMSDHEAYQEAKEQLERYEEMRQTTTSEYAKRALRDSIDLSKAVKTYYVAKRNSAMIPELPDSTHDLVKEWIPAVEQQYGTGSRTLT